ncbi:MAG: ribonuclease P protein component [Nitrospira sp.]|nr:ribonuclease P protein component [Nitrospira sp.]
MRSFFRTTLEGNRQNVSATAESRKRRPRDVFLRKSRAIEAVKQHGRRVSAEWFTALVSEVPGAYPRVGIIVGHRFGKAVCRNRIKRMFRALVMKSCQDLVPGQAILVFPKREALKVPFSVLVEKWNTTLRRAGIMRARAEEGAGVGQ